jgi:opacity protein-like surface antigen
MNDMLIGNKAVRYIVIAMIYVAGFMHTAAAASASKKLHTSHKPAVKMTKIVTILGETDIAPNYEPAPMVLQDTTLYPHVTNHQQQSHDFYDEYVTASNMRANSIGIRNANYQYAPLLDTLTVVTVSAGAQISSNLGLSQSFFALGNNYAYQAHHNAQSRALLGAFIGQEYQHSPRLAVQFGLGYYQPFSAYAVRGGLVQGPLAPAQMNYSYNVVTRQLLLESKLLTIWRQRYYPYVSLGLGEAFNNVYGYQISNPAYVAVTPFYAAKRNRSFAYRLGFGMDMELIPHLRLGLGYRFADLGRVNLGSAFINSTPINAILKQSHLYTNELLGQLSYLF